MALELDSPTLPPGKKISFNLQDRALLDNLKKNPISIKEGVEYKYAKERLARSALTAGVILVSESSSRSTTRLSPAFDTSKSSRGLESQVLIDLRSPVISAHTLEVDKLEQMLGSYGPNTQAYSKNFDPEESPSGMIARSGTYGVKSRVVDDDGEIYAGTCRPLHVSNTKTEHLVTFNRLGVVLQAHEGVVKRDRRTGFANHDSNNCGFIQAPTRALLLD